MCLNDAIADQLVVQLKGLAIVCHLSDAIASQLVRLLKEGDVMQLKYVISRRPISSQIVLQSVNLYSLYYY